MHRGKIKHQKPKVEKISTFGTFNDMCSEQSILATYSAFLDQAAQQRLIFSSISDWPVLMIKQFGGSCIRTQDLTVMRNLPAQVTIGVSPRWPSTITPRYDLT